MMASEFDRQKTDDGSSPTPGVIAFEIRSPAGLRRLEAQHIQGLEGPDLRAALGVRTWTTSRSHVLSQMFGLLTAASAVGVAVADTAGEIAAWIVIMVTCGLISAACRYGERQPRWVQVDPTGFTLGGLRFLRPSDPPRTYRWADCGPFVVDRSVGCEGGETVSVKCELGEGSLTFPARFGAEPDVAAILNAYRSMYGGTPLR